MYIELFLIWKFSSPNFGRVELVSIFRNWALDLMNNWNLSIYLGTYSLGKYLMSVFQNPNADYRLFYNRSRALFYNLLQFLLSFQLFHNYLVVNYHAFKWVNNESVITYFSFYSAPKLCRYSIFFTCIGSIIIKVFTE